MEESSPERSGYAGEGRSATETHLLDFRVGYS